jgi:predicted alpha/beta hydrolase family esterase
MKKVLLVHGFGSIPNSGWRPWLMGELSKMGVYACSLPMPTPDTPKVDAWISEIARVVDRDKKSEFILVGHSLGAATVVAYLNETKAKNIIGAVLVAGPCRLEKQHDKNRSKLSSFLSISPDFTKIKKTGKKFVVIHADNDPIVPFAHGEFYRDQLGCPLVKIKNGGHLNGSAGFVKLPQALKVVQEMLGADIK